MFNAPLRLASASCCLPSRKPTHTPSPHTLRYVILTARQPFTSPKTQDQMEVMRRIVDDRWPVRYPPYMSDTARVGGGGRRVVEGT